MSRLHVLKELKNIIAMRKLDFVKLEERNGKNFFNFLAAPAGIEKEKISAEGSFLIKEINRRQEDIDKLELLVQDFENAAKTDNQLLDALHALEKEAMEFAVKQRAVLRGAAPESLEEEVQGKLTLEFVKEYIAQADEMIGLTELMLNDMRAEAAERQRAQAVVKPILFSAPTHVDAGPMLRQVTAIAKPVATKTAAPVKVAAVKNKVRRKPKASATLPVAVQAVKKAPVLATSGTFGDRFSSAAFTIRGFNAINDDIKKLDPSAIVTRKEVHCKETTIRKTDKGFEVAAKSPVMSEEAIRNMAIQFRTVATKTGSLDPCSVENVTLEQAILFDKYLKEHIPGLKKVETVFSKEIEEKMKAVRVTISEPDGPTLTQVSSKKLNR